MTVIVSEAGTQPGTGHGSLHVMSLPEQASDVSMHRQAGRNQVMKGAFVKILHLAQNRMACCGVLPL